MVSVLLAGCGLLRKPDMHRTSGIAELRRPSHPLILIHGFLGSKLRDPRTHKVAWGTMANILTGGDTDLLALPIETAEADSEEWALEAYRIYDGLWGVEYYSKIIDSLGAAGGYRFGDIEDPRPGDDAFIFVYDWRRDIAESAARLGETIDRLKRSLGSHDVRFDLMTHSQGGLIARYYVKYGAQDVLDSLGDPRPTLAGAANVNKVIMLGTPNRGCLEFLKALHLGVKKVFRPMRPEVVFTMPAVYQMLPPSGSLLFADTAGRTVSLDLYDPETWVREGWSAFSPESQARMRRRLGDEGLAARNRQLRGFLDYALERAQRFHRALDAPGPRESVVYHAFGSDCVSTLKTAIVLDRDGRRPGREILFDEERFREKRSAERIAQILYGPGDGKVLMQSLLSLPRGPGGVEFDSAFFVCDDHGVLPGNPIFQNNLLYLLLWKGDGADPLDVRPLSGRAAGAAH